MARSHSMKYSLQPTDESDDEHQAWQINPTDDEDIASEASIEAFLIQDGADDQSSKLMPPVSVCQLVLLNTAWVGMSSCLIAWGIVLLPSQVRSTVGDGQSGVSLALVVVIGSALTLLATPYIGLLSDRNTSKFGRRRPFMLAGMVWMVLAQIFLALTNPHKPPEQVVQNCSNVSISNSTPDAITPFEPEATLPPNTFELHGNLAVLTVVYCLVTFGYQLVGTPYTGLIADKTPQSQRGLGSGINGLFTVLGNMLGAGIGFLYPHVSVLGLYLILGGLLIVTVTPVLLSQREVPFVPKAKLESLACMTVAKQYLHPMKNHDFRWVFFTRFLMQQGLATVMFFLEYYFHDQIPLPAGVRAETAVSYALIPLFICAALSSLVSGKLSDHFGGRRRVFVVTSAVVMAVSALLMALIQDFHAILGIAAAFGLGYGCFVSVDLALVLDVLPNEAERAKDLAVWHQALVLPQLIATPIGSRLCMNFCACYRAATRCVCGQSNDNEIRADMVVFCNRRSHTGWHCQVSVRRRVRSPT
eukprot:TRINITY_DN9248_c0_g1_i1.p1 TRINITY_DN9248_c0_g1~~TRINITY_DN9248_c0_g1_i1.p1  ORF type:complete len:530 (+),score=95.10 TRINITY_DN9248_c0_g1_i1:121-1710(+)